MRLPSHPDPNHSQGLVPMGGAGAHHYSAPLAEGQAFLGEPYAQPQPQQGSEGVRNIISVEDLILYLKRYWKISLIVAGSLSLLMLILLVGRTPLFRSDTHMEIIFAQQDDMPFARVAVPENSARLIVNNHKVALTTRRFQEYYYTQLSEQERTDFLEDRGFNKPLVAKGIAGFKGAVSWTSETIGGLFSSDDGGEVDPELAKQELFSKKLSESLKVDEMKESHVIRVGFTGPNRELVSNMANQYLQSYTDYLANEERSSANSNYEFLKKREEEHRMAAINSRQELNRFRIENDVLDANSVTGTVSDEVRSLNEERAKERVEFATAETVMLQAERAKKAGESLITIDELARDEGVQSVYTRLQTRQAELDSLRTIYGDRHTRVVEARLEVESIQALLEAELNRALQRFVNRKSSAEKRLVALEGELQKVLSDVLEQDKQAIELANLVARAKSDEETYERILNKLNEAKVEREIPRNSQVRVIDNAVPAEKPYRPNKPLSVVMAGMLFTMIFLSLPLTIGFSNDLSRRFGIRLPFVHRHLPDEIGQFPAVGAANSMHMLSEAFGPGEAREALYKLSTKLDAKGSKDESRIMLLTSPGKGEGKSFFAAALGGVYCSQGKKTLIIDCNLYSPAMSLWFPHLTGRTNLVEWLESNGAPGVDLEELRNGNSDLFILPAHGWAMDPEALLKRDCFGRLMKHVKQEFDVVILDGPHMSDHPDVLVLAEHATDIVLVSDRMKSDYQALGNAYAELRKAASGRVLGAISNRCDPSPL